MSSEKIYHRLSKTVHEGIPPPLLSSNLDFYWTKHKEPHVIRRKLIMAKYPGVSKLCGHEPLTKYICFMVVALQVAVAYYLRDTPFFTIKFFMLSYIIGATLNQNCFLLIHELSHNLGFKKPLHNRLFSIFVNLPIGIPYSASFQPYHQLHHKFLGDEKFDTDIPTSLELIVLSNILGKSFFATCQILFYALRPMFITQIKFTLVHLLNVAVQFAFNYVIITKISLNAYLYFVFSSFLAGSLHPCSGHFIAEHYIFDPPKNYIPNESIPPLETYSYYGILNHVTWNVGYHNEHHDFPFVSWRNLPKLREMLKEFYDDLPIHQSWVKVIYDFIVDEKVTLYCRVKRAHQDKPMKIDLTNN